MPPEVRAAVALMVGALTLYSIGVWGEVIGRRLRPWHAVFFWGGFAFDTAGTDIMRRLAGGLRWNLHTATGIAALTLMLAHAIWATVVLVRRNEAAFRTFHRISLTVWFIWLIPFVSGMILGRRRGL